MELSEIGQWQDDKWVTLVTAEDVARALEMHAWVQAQIAEASSAVE